MSGSGTMRHTGAFTHVTSGGPYPRGPVEHNPDNDKVLRAGDRPTESLHEQNQRVQRRSRIERRRERIMHLRQFVLTEASMAEIAQLEDEIRAEGEEP